MYGNTTSIFDSGTFKDVSIVVCHLLAPRQSSSFIMSAFSYGSPPPNVTPPLVARK